MAATVERPAQAYEVQLRCDCGWNMTSTGLACMSLPPEYEHRCEKCGAVEYRSQAYPRIEYRAKED